MTLANCAGDRTASVVPRRGDRRVDNRPFRVEVAQSIDRNAAEFIDNALAARAAFRAVASSLCSGT
jgi:hypothetical protein